MSDSKLRKLERAALAGGALERQKYLEELARQGHDRCFFLGIDVGLDGYLAILGPKGYVRLEPAPVVDTGKGGRRRYDLQAIVTLLCELGPVRERCFCMVEKQQPIPRQGSVPNFAVGFGLGIWLTALTAAKVPYDQVLSSVWKRRMGLIGQGGTKAERRKDSKRRSIEKAQSMFPAVNLLPTARSRVPSSDMAEALLLAEYGRREVVGSLA